jgi:hypothetical protein
LPLSMNYIWNKLHIYDQFGWPILMHSQFLEGFKCESQIEDNKRIKSRRTFLNSQHYKGVEGCARTPG